MTNSIYAVTGASKSRDLEQLLGRPTTSLADVIDETHHHHA
jgi:hypothetical protein